MCVAMLPRIFPFYVQDRLLSMRGPGGAALHECVEWNYFRE